MSAWSRILVRWAARPPALRLAGITQIARTLHAFSRGRTRILDVIQL